MWVSSCAFSTLYFWTPEVSFPPRKPCDVSLRRNISSDCDSSFLRFSRKKASPLQFGSRRGRLRQKIGDFRLRFLVLSVVRAARLQNGIALDKCLKLIKKHFKPLSRRLNMSHSLLSFSPLEIYTKKCFSPRGSAGVATLTSCRKTICQRFICTGAGLRRFSTSLNTKWVSQLFCRSVRVHSSIPEENCPALPLFYQNDPRSENFARTSAVTVMF